MFSFSSDNNKLKQVVSKKIKAANSFKKPVLNWSNAWLLWFSLCANIALVSAELSPWMLVILILCLVWQGLLLKRKVANNKQVPALLLAFFAVSGCIAIIISAKGFGVLSSMVHLLCFSYVLKAFELKQRRDFYQLWLLGVFVLASALIFKQNLAFALVSFIVFIINLAVLLHFFSGSGLVKQSVNQQSSKQPSKKVFIKESLLIIKTVTMLVVQSMILAIVLFVVFPRLAPFWQVPLAKSATTGLSDTVQPGDIANLARSTELAFRADFSGNTLPSYSQLYWRAMTLENYDGKKWTRAKQGRGNINNELNQYIEESTLTNSSLQTTAYLVIAEASFQRYLFALAPAISTDTKITALSDYTWQAKEPINQSIRYFLKSYLAAPLELELTNSSAKINLTYPINSNPKLEALAQQLRLDYESIEERSQAILNMINQQHFSYTLQPPLLNDNSLDQFFFDTKAGFCAHYASVYTFLMRASGVPARMITGYLGGEFNNKSGDEKTSQGHLSIYQYDAHAWSEIWVKGKGWLRVDPTGAVDPQRVNSGWSTELLRQQSALNSDFISLYRFKQFAWLNNLRLQFDALDYQWARLVLNYSAKQQVDLLKKLFGKMLPWKLALIITGSLVFSFVLLILVFKWRDKEKANGHKSAAWLVLYQQVLTLLAKKGLIKDTQSTVNAFAKKVRQDQPSIAILFTRFSHTFNQLNYQKLSANEQSNLEKKMQVQFKDLAQAIKSVKQQKSQK